MAQHDYNIADQDGASFLVDLNNLVQAVGTLNSGATAPADTLPFMLWADTTSGKLKQRNAANDNWIEKGDLASVDWGFLKKSNPTITGLLSLDDGADIASASTVDLTVATGNTVRITGTTAITAFTMNAGQQMELVAVGALPLTYNATTMNINGGASYTCAAGDRLGVFKDSAGVVRVNVTKQDGSAVVASGLPAGTIIHLASSSTPSGYLKANGALVSRATYANLFAAIGTTFGVGDGSTTFALPDLRAEFLRGWDDARGIDSGRVFGSAQDQAIQAHTHTVATSAGTTFFSRGSSGAALNDGGNTGSTGGTETRPRNIALLVCIKY